MLAPSSEIEESVDLDNIGKSFIDAFSTDLRMGSSIGTMGTEIAGTLGFQSWEVRNHILGLPKQLTCGKAWPKASDSR